jgi:urea transporter
VAEVVALIGYSESEVLTGLVGYSSVLVVVLIVYCKSEVITGLTG